MKETLVVTQLTTQRGAFRLPPVSFSVAAGSTLFVAGVNGSGKSTLLATVAGLQPTLGGRVEWDGRVLSEAGGHETPPWDRPVGLLLQSGGLWPHLTVRAQCALVAPTVDAAALAEWSELLGVASFLDRRPGALSGGEAQRCAMLRTLLSARPVMLLDEPYSAQHADGVAMIDRAIERLRERGVAVVVAGHREPPDATRLELGTSAVGGSR